MELYTNQLAHYKPAVNSKRENGLTTYYCSDIIVLDIETTSAWIKDGEVIGYHKGETAEFWNSLQPLSLPYIWQISYNDKVYYGREFWDLINFFDDLRKDTKYTVWVHNLSYEFQFLCNIFQWKDIFARSPHKVMKCTPVQYPNITFRCSYFLTRLSLATWGESLGVLKLKGDLDYEVVRTPLTPLTQKELDYCERDCLVVYEGIKKYIQRYGSQEDIPLTQTGTVRREVKSRLMKDKRYDKFMRRLVPHNAREYKILQQIFAGGYTHANRVYAGVVQDGIIEHYDFASSYPTVMIAEKYPMSPWVYVPEKEIPPEELYDKYAYIMKLTFAQANCKTCNTYIQSCKCEIEGRAEYDNGRVLSAPKLTIWITEQDWLTIKETYTWESVEVHEVYRSLKGYLPKALTEYILELYRNKTELKGIAEQEDLYLQSKQYINSLFGMCVTAIMQADVHYINDEWSVDKLTAEIVQAKLNELSEWSKKKTTYFLNYSWGCWVTAYARRNLWKCLLYVDDEALYCDTDSIFVLGRHDFTWYNEEITNKLQKACNECGLDYEATHPKDKHGNEHQLGIFDKEDDCIEFITLGAKRYVERRASDKKLHLTVSGINKGAVALLNDDIENFAEDFDFDKDSDYVTKKLATYISEQPIVRYPDGYVSMYNYGINLRRTGYKLTMTDEYKALINYDKIIESEETDQFIVSNRGWFA